VVFDAAAAAAGSAPGRAHTSISGR
jgi:hypothetical protein